MKPTIRVVHLLAKSKLPIEIPNAILEQLPPNLGIVTTVQHLHKVREIADKIKGTVLAGSILGCRTEAADRLNDTVDGYFFIGTGRFHPTAVALQNRKVVWCYDPKNNVLSQISAEEIEEMRIHRKSAILKYLHADKVGILITTKSGQNYVKKAVAFKQNHHADGKEYFLFGFETLDLKWLEHFPFIQCWLNTACPRIADDTIGIANVDDVEKFLITGDY